MKMEFRRKGSMLMAKTWVLIAFLIAVTAVASIGIAAEDICRVIIVGAGMSGISAANKLSKAGIENMLIVEATHRIGGRIQKTNFAGLSVEIGAGWVEGVGGRRLNPIWDMVKRLKLKTFRSNYDNISYNAYKQKGGLYEKSEAENAFYAAEELSEFIKNVSKFLKAHRQDDISILASQRLKNQVPSSPLDMAIDYMAYDYEFAEPPRVTSLLNSIPLPTFSQFGEDSYLVADPKGYESVVHFVAKQFLTANNESGEITDARLLLNKVVNEINYSKDGVSVKTEDGSVYRADYVMVSPSIGVLQSGLINFNPDLPAWKILAVYQFDMGVYTKIFLKFPRRFWPTGSGTRFFFYVHEKRGYYTAWQQLEEYPGDNVLLVTVTDDESRRIEQQSDFDTKAEITEVLRAMFGKNIPEATDILVTRWWSNRFYKGTFSNWPIGVSRFEFDRIRAPVGRVYFTGEHTSEHFNGYVHGAYLAGIDSAKMLIRCIKQGDCCQSHPTNIQDSTPFS